MPIETGHIPAMAACRLFRFARRKIPNLEITIGGRSGKLAIRRTETHVIDGFIVAAFAAQILHVGGPVFDVATSVGGEQDLVIIFPNHASNWKLVRGQNSVKIEFETIPQRKLTHGVAGDQSTPFW